MYESNIRPLPDTLNRALYNVFAAERLVLRHLSFAFGTSILVIARPTGSD